jgi:hypothetical protein
VFNCAIIYQFWSRIPNCVHELNANIIEMGSYISSILVQCWILVM